MSQAQVITVSTRAAAREYSDESGPALVAGLTKLGYHCAPVVVVPDVQEEIVAALRNALTAGFDLVLTTGGTGISPTDCTPEATAEVLDRLLPGIPEALRAAVRAQVPTVDLGRGLAGVAGRTLVVNLPGSVRAVQESLETLSGLLAHAHDQLSGGNHDD